MRLHSSPTSREKGTCCSLWTALCRIPFLQTKGLDEASGKNTGGKARSHPTPTPTASTDPWYHFLVYFILPAFPRVRLRFWLDPSEPAMWEHLCPPGLPGLHQGPPPSSNHFQTQSKYRPWVAQPGGDESSWPVG